MSAKNVMRLCDEVVRYGRPCVFGDMRDVSLVELAKRHGYANVEKLMETVEDEKYLARKVPLEYPLARGEFADFARMAKAANRKRWEEFLDRLAMPGRK